MITNYYAPPANISGQYLTLPQEEAHHAVRVLRIAPGDEITAVDGEGGWYRAVLEQMGREGAVARIIEKCRDKGEPPYTLVIGLAVLKNPSRFEVFVEKAVELGVSQIIPLLTSRTERQHFKAGRIRKLMVAAMKQCGRSRLPALSELSSLEAVLDQGREQGVSYLCHEASSDALHFDAILPELRANRTFRFLIGPEGGFTEAEVEEAASAGWSRLWLGERRLRAETAAIAVAAGVLTATL
jgi:16S rRNA (uracil1498-N3)-methyltransferase